MSFSSQIFKILKISYDDFQKINDEAKPLDDHAFENVFYSLLENDNQRCDMIDEHLLKVDHSYDVDYWRSLGDPIYDTSSVESVDFEPF